MFSRMVINRIEILKISILNLELIKIILSIKKSIYFKNSFDNNYRFSR